MLHTTLKIHKLDIVDIENVAHKFDRVDTHDFKHTQGR